MKKYIFIYFITLLSQAAFSQFLLLEDTVNTILYLGNNNIKISDIKNYSIDTNNYIKKIKSVNNVNSSISIYIVRQGTRSSVDINNSKYIIKWRDELYLDSNEISFYIIDTILNKYRAYAIIKKKSKYDILISGYGTTVSIDKDTYKTNWIKYGGCEIMKFFDYATGCGYFNHFLAYNNKYIIADKRYSNFWHWGNLKQSYVSIDWETGNEITLCKDCEARLLSKDGQWLVLEKKDSRKKKFIIINLVNTKIKKEVYANRVYWVNLQE